MDPVTLTKADHTVTTSIPAEAVDLRARGYRAVKPEPTTRPREVEQKVTSVVVDDPRPAVPGAPSPVPGERAKDPRE